MRPLWMASCLFMIVAGCGDSDERKPEPGGTGDAGMGDAGSGDAGSGTMGDAGSGDAGTGGTAGQMVDPNATPRTRAPEFV
ncbi:MAG: hypothetical protein HY698_09195 [Deltaproteobacteria bacterium]|nr:hypothetical protein [Deltaproteobacteria bacterium]